MVPVRMTRADHSSMVARVAGLALAGTIMTATSLPAQISPGPLATAHASLDGATTCTRCHGTRRGDLPAQCLTCHRDIGWLAERQRGLHGRSPARGASCASCHPDHAGRDFALVAWGQGGKARFDHDRAGWPLAARHAEARCEACHTPAFQTAPTARLSARRGGGRYTGLDPSCTTCHDDIHRGALGATCTTCHDAAGWTRTPGFSHDTTAYRLTGEHARVACDRCHLAPRLATARDRAGHRIPVYRPVPFGACTDCHTDPHRGGLGTECTSCHSTQGFSVFDAARFDHDRTRYPLEGRHAAVTCAKCHRTFSTAAERTPSFARCSSCHEDAHAGTATIEGRSADCGACHTVTGFSRATYSVERHARSRYPLAGRHTTVACRACHTRTGRGTGQGSAGVVMRPAAERCDLCHGDAHGTQRRATDTLDSSQPRSCEPCHRVTGWAPSTFDSAAHARTGFALTGRHAGAACTVCHALTRSGLPSLPGTDAGTARFLFRVPETSCAACHVDPHLGRFAPGGARAADGGCAACHDTHVFRPSRVDVSVHATFAFTLAGAHRAIPCSACHRQLTTGTTTDHRSTLIRGGSRFDSLTFATSRTCADCHRTPHGAQFATGKTAGRCDACHTEEAFAPAARFDHDRDAAFRLTGGHAGVPCLRCHHPARDNPQQVIYRPLATRCEACHAKEPR